ncbi:hypothetical protein [Sphingomicrobium nitratireducens]|uniref:hypothetical protein n=1 Tax=Sphingomicrobium nitratireducens TaxID=2964666 RepID=UPI00223EF2C4|nr:hypothetical protein [Sphingomicrobium nitratireducens]
MHTLIAAFAMAALVQPVTAQPASPLQPTTKWAQGFDGVQCLALRDYGPVHLAIKAYGIGPGLDISLVEDGASAPELTAIGQVGTETGSDAAPATRFAHAEANRLVSTWMASDSSMLFDADTLTLTLGERTVSLALTNMQFLVPALDRCRLMLQRAYDPTWADLPELPGAREGGADVFGAFDYASVAADPTTPSRFRALLLLDEQGAIIDCTLTEHEGDPVALVQACGVIRSEAQFAPATDGGGAPVRSAVLSDPIVWARADEDVANTNRRQRSEQNALEGYNDAVRGNNGEGALLRPPGDANTVTYPQGRGD